MPFTLPDFNCVYEFWTAAHNPLGHPLPDITDVPGQVYIDSRRRVPWKREDNPNEYFPIILRTPLTTYRPIGRDIFRETLPGETRYYLVIWEWNIHRGFPNEYIQSLAVQCAINGVPISMGPP